MKPLSHAVPNAVAELLRDAPLSPGKVDFAWKTAVGPALARTTSIRLEGTRLLVEGTSPQWTREITRLSSIILSRLKNLLGSGVITEIRVRTAD